jgi:hypothetical protein
MIVEELKTHILSMTPQAASAAICSAVEEWPELYDLLIEGLGFEILEDEGDGLIDADDGEDEDEDDEDGDFS